MKESLEKIIKRVILPKYPWIKEFIVIESPIGGLDVYVVFYYVNSDLSDNSVRYKNAESTTKTLYDVLGPSPSDGGVRVVFRSY